MQTASASSFDINKRHFELELAGCNYTVFKCGVYTENMISVSMATRTSTRTYTHV